MHSSLFLVITMGALSTWAAPQNFLGVGGGGYFQPDCGWTMKPKTANTEVHDGTAELLSYTCTSSTEGNCGLTDSATYTHGTSWSVGGGLDLKFKIPDFPAEVSPKFQFGYSWTDTSGESHSARVECPPGGFKCGLIVTPLICKITGKADSAWDEPTKTQGCNDKPGEQDYSIESVCMRGDSANQNMNAVTDFEACVLECNEADRCDKDKANKMKPCPGVQGYPF